MASVRQSVTLEVIIDGKTRTLLMGKDKARALYGLVHLLPVRLAWATHATA